MAELFITFGGRYRHEQHPTFPLAHPDGYLTVEYREDPEADPGWDRERARQCAWTWLRGAYAFDYDAGPELEMYPRGELARMVLP